LPGVPGPYTLALDRTNWKVGAVDLNTLALSIVYRGVEIPVVWNVLPKSGNSKFCERPNEQYKKRWGIETLFGVLKSLGFNS
jgi:hypothetical protein